MTPAAEALLKAVENSTGVPRWRIMGDRRAAPTVRARHALAWGLREVLGLSSPAAGSIMGVKHDAILYGQKAFEARIAREDAPALAAVQAMKEAARHMAVCKERHTASAIDALTANIAEAERKLLELYRRREVLISAERVVLLMEKAA